MLIRIGFPSWIIISLLASCMVTFPSISTGDPHLGDTRFRSSDEANMVYVPAGQYLMGNDIEMVNKARKMCKQYKGVLGIGTCQQIEFMNEFPAHKVHIDYYPPRGDAKEAWDAIDFSGMFGLPMSMKVNLLGRDSILAAPLVIDLARWVSALKLTGRSGPIPELAFFFKKPVGGNPPLTFQDQIAGLQKLECEYLKKQNA